MKIIQQVINKLEELYDKYGYLRVHENWHKHPVVSKALCWIGRHDFEFGHIDSQDPEQAILWCMYCSRTRSSRTNWALSYINRKIK